jgi:hypothetical protein
VWSARRKGAASGVDARVRRGTVEDLYPPDNGEEPTIVGLELMSSSSSASGPLTCVYVVVTGAAHSKGGCWAFCPCSGAAAARACLWGAVLGATHSKGACRESCPSSGAEVERVAWDAKAAARMGGMLASTSGRDWTGGGAGVGSG